MRIRSDNGTQPVSNKVDEFLTMMNICHEGDSPYTSKQNTHIGSFNSILRKEAIRRFDFECFGYAGATIGRYVEF